MLLFVLNVNSTSLRTRACAFNLQVPYKLLLLLLNYYYYCYYYYYYSIP